jgi:DNA-binding response OmpR family regulator
MRYPQVLVYESDGKLAAFLRDATREQRWSLREPRSLEGCLRLLRRGGPNLLIIKLGKDLVREMTILDQVHWLFPATAVFLVGDAENASVEALAWELGAQFVLFPPIPRQELIHAMASFLKPVTKPESGVLTDLDLESEAESAKEG